MTDLNDEIALALMEHLGPDALTHTKVTPMDAFERGYRAGRAAQPVAAPVLNESRLLKAAKNYAMHYVQDEAELEDDPQDLVCTVEQNVMAVELFAAIKEAEQRPAVVDGSDAARLDFIGQHPEMTLRCHKKRWAFIGFTNYEYEVFQTPREAIDAAMQRGEGERDER